MHVIMFVFRWIQITPALTATEQAKNIFLSPPSRVLTVSDAPVLNAHFVQARVKVSGRVRCYGGSGACAAGHAKVVMTSRNEDQRALSQVTDKGKYSCGCLLF